MASHVSNDLFYSRISSFLSWLRDRSGTTISCKIEITDLRAHNAGRGIGNDTSSVPSVLTFAEASAVAVEDIEEDEKLFTIAHSDVLTVQNSSLQQVKPQLLVCLDSWNSLILVMIYEDGLGERSKWWNYLQMLPTDLDVRISRVRMTPFGLIAGQQICPREFQFSRHFARHDVRLELAALTSIVQSRP